jgi:membrane fusion protein, multidrug efflux system
MRTSFQLATAAAVILLGAVGWYIFASNANGQTANNQGGGHPTPVDVALARSGEVVDAIEIVGTARAREAVTIVARTSGRVARILFEEGQVVKAGMPLVELDSEAERAELRQARAQLEDARAQYERARSLGGSRHIAEAEVETRRSAVAVAQARVDLARARLAEQQISAPFDGIVGIREISLGAVVDPQTRLTTLDDLSSVRLDFHVPERFLARVTAGRTVIARSAAYPDQAFDGEVTQVDSRVDPVTRSVRVQALIPNQDRHLRPGMFLTVEMLLARRPDAVLVPEEALIVEGTRRYVYVVSEGRAQRTEVRTGVRRDGLVEITQGVHPGDPVVVGGSQRLRGESALVRVRLTDGQAATAAAG